jgi:hypothetical protein
MATTKQLIILEALLSEPQPDGASGGSLKGLATKGLIAKRRNAPGHELMVDGLALLCDEYPNIKERLHAVEEDGSWQGWSNVDRRVAERVREMTGEPTPPDPIACGGVLPRIPDELPKLTAMQQTALKVLATNPRPNINGRVLKALVAKGLAVAVDGFFDLTPLGWTAQGVDADGEAARDRLVLRQQMQEAEAKRREEAPAQPRGSKRKAKAKAKAAPKRATLPEDCGGLSATKTILALAAAGWEKPDIAAVLQRLTGKEPNRNTLGSYYGSVRSGSLVHGEPPTLGRKALAQLKTHLKAAQAA